MRHPFKRGFRGDGSTHDLNRALDLMQRAGSDPKAAKALQKRLSSQLSKGDIVERIKHQTGQDVDASQLAGTLVEQVAADPLSDQQRGFIEDAVEHGTGRRVRPRFKRSAGRRPSKPDTDRRDGSRPSVPQWRVGGHHWLWLPALALLIVVGLVLAHHHGSAAQTSKAASISVTTTPSGQVVKTITVTIPQHTTTTVQLQTDEASIGGASPTASTKHARTASAPAPATGGVTNAHAKAHTTATSTTTTKATTTGTTTSPLAPLTGPNGPFGKKNLKFFKGQVITGFGQILHFLGITSLRSPKIPPWVFAIAAIFAVIFLISAIRLIRSAAMTAGFLAVIGFLVFGGGTIAHFI